MLNLDSHNEGLVICPVCHVHLAHPKNECCSYCWEDKLRAVLVKIEETRKWIIKKQISSPVNVDD